MGLQPRCKPCAAEDTKIWRSSKDPEYLKDRYYQNHYGMSLNEFQLRLEHQNNSCKICQRLLVLQALTGDSVVVDHCHTSGEVRGLLCNECNRGLGYFRDSPNALKAAAAYLETYNAFYEERKTRLSSREKLGEDEETSESEAEGGEDEGPESYAEGREGITQ